MKRETEFRGLNSKTKEWEFGYMVIDEDGTHHIVSSHGKSYSWNEVDEETVGLFIGFKDQKGRKIFEGDIYFQEVEQNEGDVRIYSVMVWLEDRCLFTFLTKGEYIAFEDDAPVYLDEFETYEFSRSDLKYLHYAGNIHKNPDLLS